MCNALVRRSHRFIKFPIAQGIEENKRKLYVIGNFPNIFGLIDGTYVRMIAPSQHEDQFVNRKEYHSINVQVVVNADSQFINTCLDEENFAFKLTLLFSYSSNNTTFYLSVQFGFRLDIFCFQQSRIVTFKHIRP